MKIYQVVPYYPPHLGGMEFYVRNLSERLVSMGHDVTVFTASNNTNQSIYNRNGVKVISLKIMKKVYNIPIIPSLFWELLEKDKPAVIHAHQYPVFCSDVSSCVSWLRGIPLLLHVHVVSEAKSPLSGFVSNLYYSSLGLSTLRSADVVVAPSLAYKSKLELMHVNPEKIRVVPCGIDVESFYKCANVDLFKERFGCKGSKIILSVGRLNYQKGFRYLIEAMYGVIRQLPDTKLIIIGEGEQLASLQNLASKLEISKSVVFTGMLSEQDLLSAYASADVFVLPSLFESLGISLLEAQAANKPVIATRTGGAPETLIEGKSGLIVDPANSKQLQEAIIRLLSDQSLRLKMGSIGRCHVKSNFDFQTTVNKIIDTYKKVAK